MASSEELGPVGIQRRQLVAPEDLMIGIGIGIGIGRWQVVAGRRWVVSEVEVGGTGARSQEPGVGDVAVPGLEGTRAGRPWCCWRAP